MRDVREIDAFPIIFEHATYIFDENKKLKMHNNALLPRGKMLIEEMEKI